MHRRKVLEWGSPNDKKGLGVSRDESTVGESVSEEGAKDIGKRATKQKEGGREEYIGGFG